MAEIRASAYSDTEERLYHERRGHSDIPSLEAGPSKSFFPAPDASEGDERALRFRVAERPCQVLGNLFTLASKAEGTAEDFN